MKTEHNTRCWIIGTECTQTVSCRWVRMRIVGWCQLTTGGRNSSCRLAYVQHVLSCTHTRSGCLASSVLHTQLGCPWTLLGDFPSQALGSSPFGKTVNAPYGVGLQWSHSSKLSDPHHTPRFSSLAPPLLTIRHKLNHTLNIPFSP